MTEMKEKLMISKEETIKVKADFFELEDKFDN